MTNNPIICMINNDPKNSDFRKGSLEDDNYHRREFMSKIHYLMMAICGLMVLGALAAIFLFGASINIVFLVAMLVICPLLHFVMMRFMGHSHGDSHGHHHQVTPRKES